MEENLTLEKPRQNFVGFHAFKQIIMYTLM